MHTQHTHQGVVYVLCTLDRVQSQGWGTESLLGSIFNDILLSLNLLSLVCLGKISPKSALMGLLSIVVGE